MRKDFLLGIAVISIFIFPVLGFASTTTPNLQERRALQEAQAMQMKKQQEVAIFIRKRDEMLLTYKAMVKLKNDHYGQLKIAERDYRTAMAEFEEARKQSQRVETQISQLLQKGKKLDPKVRTQELERLRKTNEKLTDSMKIFSKVQQDSYENMLNADSRYRNVLAQEQVLRQQVDNIQRQLQFVLSQP